MYLFEVILTLFQIDQWLMMIMAFYVIIHEFYIWETLFWRNSWVKLTIAHQFCSFVFMSRTCCYNRFMASFVDNFCTNCQKKSKGRSVLNWWCSKWQYLLENHFWIAQPANKPKVSGLHNYPRQVSTLSILVCICFSNCKMQMHTPVLCLLSYLGVRFIVEWINCEWLKHIPWHW